MTWEYLVTEYRERVPSEVWSDAVAVFLNERGAEGWELIDRVGNTFIFKRRVVA
jgi:hypothetical protein